LALTTWGASLNPKNQVFRKGNGEVKSGYMLEHPSTPWFSGFPKTTRDVV